MNKVGDKIYNLRKEKKLSQEELAEKLNVARPTISRWENNAVQPTMENIKSLCEMFNVAISYFFDNEEEIAVVKAESPEQAEENKNIKKGKFKTLKIVSIVVGMVLLALCVIACGIAAYVTAMPEMGGAWTYTSHSVNYKEVIFIIVGVIVLAVFLTLSIILLRKHLKNKKNKNCNTVSANCNTDVTDK